MERVTICSRAVSNVASEKPFSPIASSSAIKLLTKIHSAIRHGAFDLRMANISIGMRSSDPLEKITRRCHFSVEKDRDREKKKKKIKKKEKKKGPYTTRDFEGFEVSKWYLTQRHIWPRSFTRTPTLVVAVVTFAILSSSSSASRKGAIASRLSSLNRVSHDLIPSCDGRKPASSRRLSSINSSFSFPSITWNSKAGTNNFRNSTSSTL